jgi:hypothetical protein
MRNPMKSYVDPDVIELRMGQDPIISMHVGSIILYAARIEFHIERAIWRLTNLKPEGTRPHTDAKMITDLITNLEEVGLDRLSGDAAVMVSTWCTAARNAFLLRHDIAHGISYSITGAFIFNRNPRMEGELRKRSTTILWTDENILGLIRDAFAVLFRCIQGLSVSKMTANELASQDCLAALRDARSVVGEFSSPGYNPSFEKY